MCAAAFHCAILPTRLQAEEGWLWQPLNRQVPLQKPDIGLSLGTEHQHQLLVLTLNFFLASANALDQGQRQLNSGAETDFLRVLKTGSLAEKGEIADLREYCKC